MQDKTQNEKWVKGSGNVFVDLGFTEDEATEFTLRSILAETIKAVIVKSGLTQAQVAQRLDIDQPKVSKLLNGKISGFSSERLTTFLLKLHCDIIITIKDAPPDANQGRVTAERQFESSV